MAVGKKHITSTFIKTLLLTLGTFASGSVYANVCEVILDDPPNGCSSVGEQVKDVNTIYGVNFTSDCYQHDICYRQIGTRQSICDAEFLGHMRKSCIAGPDGSIGASFGAVILSCGLPSGLSSLASANMAPASTQFGLQNDFISDLGNVIVRPVKEVQRVTERVGRAVVNEVNNVAGSVRDEYHRIDDNAKEFRDNTVESLIDGLETVEGVLETVPGSNLVFSIVGRPSEVLQCMYSETLSFARNPNLLNEFNPASYTYSAGAYPSCVVASNIMYNGPRIAAEASRLSGDETIFEGRQEVIFDEALRLARLKSATGSNCFITASESGLFRNANNDETYTTTIRRIFVESLGRAETETEYNQARRHAQANPNDWQFSLINALDVSTNPSLDSLAMAASYERIRPGAFDLDFRNAVLAPGTNAGVKYRSSDLSY